MILQRGAALTFLVGLCAFLFRFFKSEGDSLPIQGKNNTVLFFTIEHPGCNNVHLSTVYSLLEKHPEIEIHYASFPKVETRIQHISSLASKQGSEARDVTFHTLPGRGFAESIAKLFMVGNRVQLGTHGPGLDAGDHFAQTIGSYMAPWAEEEYWAIYEFCVRLIEKIDPAVVIIDTFLSPGVDATRDRNRLHALITPNIISDLLPAAQPIWTMFWKYPAVGTGYPYPVPWNLIPANIYVNFQILHGMFYETKIAAKRRFLKTKGIKNPINFSGLYRPNVPWLTQTLPGAHLPFTRIPKNVTLTGPINLAGLEERSLEARELLEWVKKPTVMVCLGSGFGFREDQAKIMLEALQNVLKAETEVQILWKLSRLEPFDDQFLENAIQDSDGRLRIETWLEVEPPTLLQEGNILLYVHHGGAGSYHDSIL